MPYMMIDQPAPQRAKYVELDNQGLGVLADAPLDHPFRLDTPAGLLLGYAVPIAALATSGVLAAKGRPGYAALAGALAPIAAAWPWCPLPLPQGNNLGCMVWLGVPVAMLLTAGIPALIGRAVKKRRQTVLPS